MSKPIIKDSDGDEGVVDDRLPSGVSYSPPETGSSMVQAEPDVDADTRMPDDNNRQTPVSQTQKTPPFEQQPATGLNNGPSSICIAGTIFNDILTDMITTTLVMYMYKYG